MKYFISNTIDKTLESEGGVSVLVTSGLLILTSIIAVFFTSSVNFGFKLLLLIATILITTPITFIAVSLSNSLRLVLIPNFVITSRYRDLLLARMFWSVGPQIIAGALGCESGFIIINTIFFKLFNIEYLDAIQETISNLPF